MSGDLSLTVELKHSLFFRPLIKEKLGQGVTLVVDRYAFSGVAFTSAKEVRAAWPRWGGAVWRAVLVGTEQQLEHRCPPITLPEAWASHPFARIRSLLLERTYSHVAADCFHRLTVFFPWTVHFTSHIFTDGLSAELFQPRRRERLGCFAPVVLSCLSQVAWQ